MLYNVGSLGFGFAAWIIPAVASFMKHTDRSTTVFASLACSIICMVLVIFGLHQEVVTGDFAAIADTIGALRFASVVQAVVTLVFNAIGIAKGEKGV